MFETWPGFELAASSSADFPANILLLNCYIVWFILYPVWFVSLSVWWSVEAPVTSLATDPQSHLMSTFVAFNKNKSHCEWVLRCTLLPGTCVASVSVCFGSKKRPRNGILGFGRTRNETRSKKWKRSFTYAIFRAVFDPRSSFFAPIPHETLATQAMLPGNAWCFNQLYWQL